MREAARQRAPPVDDADELRAPDGVPLRGRPAHPGRRPDLPRVCTCSERLTMAYAITQSCCSDATCVRVCPVNCIHPTPEEPGLRHHASCCTSTRETCIDCGACADACPVDAVNPPSGSPLPSRSSRHSTTPTTPAGTAPTVWGEPAFPQALPPRAAGRGSRWWAPARPRRTPPGAAAPTAAEVTLIDRLPLPAGWSGRGRARPPSTKQVGDSFARLGQPAGHAAHRRRGRAGRHRADAPRAPPRGVYAAAPVGPPARRAGRGPGRAA